MGPLEMDVNPYESPRPGEPFAEHGIGHSDPIVRLLIEIRDGQREALELQREALERVRGTGRFFFFRIAMAIPFVIIIISFFFTTRLMRSTSPAPPPATRATPTFPTPPPSTFR